ncbi:SDR family NAD(P)-dependent oxidoreductase [Flexivirga meconopsidis]|uniref:SDR family NAD(P)-dependent oxidoreductase n=1 Tax=Flexivirga meconopsidis TaxID=2977121 RepID=UPI002240115D|nr:SDR family NAD(P)-dependent oxidoreductase [Flexivirga meconopsidis]
MSKRASRPVAGLSVVITGAANGIGRSTAALFAARGARVVIGDIHAEAAALAAQEIGASTVGLPLDVRREESFDTFLGAAEAAHGQIDILINNAGVDWMGPFHLEPFDVTLRQLEVNLLGAILGSRLGLKRMLPRGGGHLINVASAAGRTPQPGSAVYTATKYGVVGLTEALKLEYRDSGVTFSVVQPGQIDTAMMDGTHPSSRLLPKVGPDVVAQEIVRAVEDARFEVWAPRSQGFSVKLGNFVPRAAREAVLLKLGVQDIAGKASAEERAAYVERAFGGD